MPFCFIYYEVKEVIVTTAEMKLGWNYREAEMNGTEMCVAWMREAICNVEQSRMCIGRISSGMKKISPSKWKLRQKVTNNLKWNQNCSGEPDKRMVTRVVTNSYENLKQVQMRLWPLHPLCGSERENCRSRAEMCLARVPS